MINVNRARRGLFRTGVIFWYDDKTLNVFYPMFNDGERETAGNPINELHLFEAGGQEKPKKTYLIFILVDSLSTI